MDVEHGGEGLEAVGDDVFGPDASGGGGGGAVVDDVGGGDFEGFVLQIEELGGGGVGGEVGVDGGEGFETLWGVDAG